MIQGRRVLQHPRPVFLLKAKHHFDFPCFLKFKKHDIVASCSHYIAVSITFGCEIKMSSRRKELCTVVQETRTLLTQPGWSKSKLAREAGLRGDTTLRYIEEASWNPTLSTLTALADFLDEYTAETALVSEVQLNRASEGVSPIREKKRQLVFGAGSQTKEISGNYSKSNERGVQAHPADLDHRRN